MRDASATRKITSRIWNHRLFRKYFRLVHEDLSAVYARNLRRWLVIAPLIGLSTGLAITAISVIILGKLWPPVLAFYLGHHWAIVPGLVLGMVAAGLIMQHMTPDPDEHSTEEVIRSYHEHQGDINMRPFFPKLIAAITTVGFGGSAALEGPSIYSGAAIGSWLWEKLRLDARDRRIMLICGAAAGMSAVFRAPLTGIVFALEMPYRDDLAHEALLPSLMASVISYVTLISFMGSQPLFDFAGASSFSRQDLYWSVLLGLIIGLIAMAFVITFRRARSFFVKWAIPHWMKLGIGGLLTGACGALFVGLYPGGLIPIGPNYEAIGLILGRHHSTAELVTFGGLKLAATIFTLGAGGVSAMFVPLFLVGGVFGTAFAQSIIHSPLTGLYAAVGMASFIAAGYKTPLAAVVFVAEATGGHAFLIPALIGSAVAYAVSGDASASGDQRLHEAVRVEDLKGLSVKEIMHSQLVRVEASLTVREFAQMLSPHNRHETFPVFEDRELLGTVSLWSVTQVSPEKWDSSKVRDLTDRKVKTVSPDCDVMEALRLLMAESALRMLIVSSSSGRVEGIVTKTDILNAMQLRRNEPARRGAEAGVEDYMAAR